VAACVLRNEQAGQDHQPKPFFFAEPSVTNINYLDMLQLWLMPQLQEDSEDFIFKQDRVLPHFHFDSTKKNGHGQWPWLACSLHRQPCCWNFLCHSRIVLSLGGSWSETFIASGQLTQFWQIPRHSMLSYALSSPCFIATITTDHDYPLAVKSASTPWRPSPKQTWRDSLPINMLLSAVSFLVVALRSSEVPEGLYLMVLMVTIILFENDASKNLIKVYLINGVACQYLPR
jgi:hypothetical protein